MVPADYTSELAQRLGYQGRADRRPASPLPIRTFIPPYTRNLSSRLPRLQTPDRVHARRAHTEGSGEGGREDAGVRVYRGGGGGQAFGGGARVTRHFQFVSPC